MRFFLVGRDRSSGMVRIVSETPLESRQEALDSLPSVIPADGSMDEYDLFVVDLDAVTPVVMVKAPGAGRQAPEEPMADAWEAPPSAADLPPDLLEPLDDSAPAPEAGLSPGLADALRRAATALEDEGISAPPQVEELAAMSLQAADAESSADMAADFAVLGETEPSPTELVHEVPAEPMSAKDAPEVEADWPWESATLAGDSASEEASDEEPVEPLAKDAAAVLEPPVEAVSDEEPPSAEEPPAEEPQEAEETSPEGAAEGAAFTPVGIEEPAVSEFTLIPASADPFMPQPVIMGDYADSPIGEAGLPEAQPAAAEGEIPVLELDSALLAEAGVASEEIASEAPDLPDMSAEPSDQPPVEPDAEAADDAKVYEPGAVDIAAYACDDCVYVTTCPKHHEDGPATCGSFQWKS